MKLWHVAIVIAVVVIVGVGAFLMLFGSEPEGEEQISGTIVDCTPSATSYDSKLVYTMVLYLDDCDCDEIFCIIIEPEFDHEENLGRKVVFYGKHIDCSQCIDQKGFLVNRYTIS
jgi:hypothetical protein